MKFAIAWVAGVGSTVVCGVVTGLLTGHIGVGVSALSLVVGLAAAICASWHTRDSWISRPQHPASWLLMAVFAFAVWRGFFFLIYSDGSALRIGNVNNLGDLPKHINYIIHLSRTQFWPANPLIASGAIHYPFGMDLLNALLASCGVGLKESLVWTGLLSMAATWMLLMRWGGAFAVAGVLFNGGLLGFLFFSEFNLRDYQAEAAWKNIFLSLIVPQRGFLFALPAGLLVMCGLSELLHEHGSKVPRWIGGSILGVMPLFHLHTWMFLVGLLGFWIMFGPRRLRRELVIAYVPGFLVSIAFAYAVSDGFSGGSHIRWAPGWMAGEGGVSFWMINFGFFIPLLAGVLILARKNVYDRMWLWPCSILLLLLSLFAFAPWLWDNTKLFIWCYICVLPVLGKYLSGMHFLPRLGWYIGLFFSGAVSLFGGLLDPGVELMPRKRLHAAEMLLRSLPTESRIACAPEFHHPAYFLGYLMAAGYDGHLYGHGLDYGLLMQQLEGLMNGEQNAEQMGKELQATHILWSELEARRYPASTQKWKEFSRLVRSVEGAELYQLTYSLDEKSGRRP